MKYIIGILFSLFGVIGSGFLVFIGYIARGMPHSAGAEQQGNLVMGIFAITGMVCIWLVFWFNRRRKDAKNTAS